MTEEFVFSLDFDFVDNQWHTYKLLIKFYRLIQTFGVENISVELSSSKRGLHVFVKTTKEKVEEILKFKITDKYTWYYANILIRLYFGDDPYRVYYSLNRLLNTPEFALCHATVDYIFDCKNKKSTQRLDLKDVIPEDVLELFIKQTDIGVVDKYLLNNLERLHNHFRKLFEKRKVYYYVTTDPKVFTQICEELARKHSKFKTAYDPTTNHYIIVTDTLIDINKDKVKIVEKEVCSKYI